MCTELILASLYFFTIFVVNYFLFRLVKISFQNVSYLEKIKQFGKFFQKFYFSSEENQKKTFSLNSSNFLSYFFILLKKDAKKVTFSTYLSKFKKTQDLLILGNTYHLLMECIQADSLEKNASSSNLSLNTYYFRLLENQYLG